MARYLWQMSYTADAVKGVLKEGGTSRRSMTQKLIEGVGGRLETFDFAFGAEDVYIIAELPDNVTAAAIGLTVAASGVGALKTVVLLTPEEVDEASKRAVDYRPPGA